MPAGIDPLPIPPNDDILLPDDDIPPPPSSASHPSQASHPPKAKKRKRKEIKFLTEDELARLFSAIHSVRDRAIFQLAYRAGLRASEIGLLQLRDYDPKADKIFIHRLKGSNSGEHHLVREEARALRAWLKARGSFPGTLFPSQRKAPISRQQLDKLMRRYGAEANLPKTLRHFHVLKHCCATHLLSKGFGVERVQDWIGHANIQSTMEYAKVTNARRDDMAQQLKDSWK